MELQRSRFATQALPLVEGAVSSWSQLTSVLLQQRREEVVAGAAPVSHVLGALRATLYIALQNILNYS